MAGTETTLARLTQKKAKLESKIRELTKELALTNIKIKHRQELEILQQSDAPLLGTDEGNGPRVLTTATGPVQGVSGTLENQPILPQKPKAKAEGPACPSCGERNSLYRTSRTMTNGKTVPLVVCGSCKTEQIG